MGCDPQFEKLVLECPDYTGLIYLRSPPPPPLKIWTFEYICKLVHTLQGADIKRASRAVSVRLPDGRLAWNRL